MCYTESANDERNHGVMNQWLRGMLACTGVTAALVGCSTGPPIVAKDDVAKEISTQLEQQVGKAPEEVTCPEDLKGEVGATLRCELKDNSETYGVNVTVTSVEGTNVKFDLKVDDKPQ